jgi:3'(2'), 5'-bisphosphate nucleotidase
MKWVHFREYEYMIESNMIDIEKIIKIAINAGKVVLEIYNSDDFDIQTKMDDSPITRADIASHNLIKQDLLNLDPDIPIFSEEGSNIPYDTRKTWKRYWLVDPLDGTKEFIKRNGEFTINIALIENNYPVFGVIYAPSYERQRIVSDKDISNDFNFSTFEVNQGALYFAHKDFGSYKIVNLNKSIKLYKTEDKSNNLIAVRSKSHSSEEEQKVLNDLKVREYIFVGSSLKFCMIAEGLAQVYYRHGPTNEWDVAAGFAIAKYAGAEISGLSFNKQNLLNGSFIVKV